MHIADGLITMASTDSVTTMLDRVEASLRDHGFIVFARIDHAGEAAKVGLSMPASQVLVFGNPRGGTPLMLANPATAIDLPLKAVAWQDELGQVWLGYNDPQYIAHRFGLTSEQVATIAPVGALISRAVLGSGPPRASRRDR